ncbi:hypothetical protein JS518_14185 [Clostridiales bacterium FE2010]|nr:hypothetical protein JS518_14185 [Clostridiales bacterium FE2010]
MKKILSLFLALLMISLPIISNAGQEKESDIDTARAIADLMETQYDITVLIGSECSGFSGETFSIGDKPAGRSPFRTMLGGCSYTTEIQMIDDTLSIYPAGFFEKFKCEEAPKGLRILLPNQILHEEKSMAGTITIEDGYYNLFLAVGMFKDLNIHHELWHVMEDRILQDSPNAFDHWTDLNPENFQYSEDYFEMDIWEQAEPQDDWFARGYGTIDEIEDHATVIEAIFQHDPDWWAQRPHLQKKLDFLLEAAEPIFGNVYSMNK